MWEPYRKQVEDYLSRLALPAQPEGLYAPVRYVLSMGGKRIRPVLTLAVGQGYGATASQCLPAGAALEIFHNFTLLHDDIMDRADLRRGKPTVHKRWNLNTAILSGDAMVHAAQQQLEKYPPEVFKAMQSMFNRTALELCEGQQEDMDFETMPEVRREAYLEMIRKKTGVLLGLSMAFGGLAAGAPDDDIPQLFDAGVSLGLAFQIADDLLDTFGDERFGKRIGGDIREAKKTFLFVSALEALSGKEKAEFIRRYNRTDKTADEVEAIRSLFTHLKTDRKARAAIDAYTGRFFELLEHTSLDKTTRNQLAVLAEQLAGREV